jgi:hypothetical protein
MKIAGFSKKGSLVLKTTQSCFENYLTPFRHGNQFFFSALRVN